MKPHDLDDALADGVRRELNRVGAEHGCPPLDWRVRGRESTRPGCLSGMAAHSLFTQDGAAAALTCWANLLHLDLDADKYVSLRYSGEVDGHPVEVWYLPPVRRRERPGQP